MIQSDPTRRHVLAGAAGAVATAIAGCLGDGDDPGHDEPHAAIEAEVDAYVVAYHWGYAAFDEHGDELDLIEVAPNTELTIHAVNDHAYDAFEELPDPVASQLEEFDGLARTKQKVEEGIYDEPHGRTVEEVYEDAHGHAHDDHDDGHDDHDDGHDDDDDHMDATSGYISGGGALDDNVGAPAFVTNLDTDRPVVDHGEDQTDDDHGDHGDDDHDHGHEDASLDHGFRVRALNIDFDVPADATEPTTKSAVVEEPGTYMAECTVPCGHYHGSQRQDLIRVNEDG